MAELPPNFAQYQSYRDDEHIKLLSIFHYILGGMNMLLGCAGFIYVLIGIVAASGGMDTPHQKDPFPATAFGTLFIVIGSAIVLFGLVLGSLTIYTGLCLVRRQKSTLIYVISGINCLQVPWGTLLGVFTILVMGRPTVKAQFDSPASPPLSQ